MLRRPTKRVQRVARAWAVVGWVSLLVSFPALPAESQGTLSPARVASGGTPLERAEVAFSKGAMKDALPLYQEVLKNAFVPPREAALAQCRVGVIFSLQGKNADARAALEKSIASQSLTSRQIGLCQYALLQVYVLQKADIQARELLKRMGNLDLPAIYQARTHAVAAEVGQRLGDGPFEAMALQKLLAAFEVHKFPSVEVKVFNRTYTRSEIAERLGMPTRRSQRVAQAGNGNAAAAKPDTSPVRSGNTQAVANEVLSSNSSSAETGVVPSNALSAAIPESQRAARALAVDFFRSLAQGQNQEALAFLQPASGEKPGADFMVYNGLTFPLEKLEERLRRLRADAPRDMRIGIIVPAASSFTRFKHKILRSVSAFAASTAVKDVNFSFKVRATANELGAVEEAVRALVLDDHVHVVIGPLSGTQALGAVSFTQAFAVPTFAYGPVTWSPDVNSPYLVRMGVLARSQAAVHIRHLQEDLRFENAGVLAPNDSYGFEMASAFIDVAKEKNFALDRVTYFDVTKDQFQDSVLAALGPQDPDSRREEYRAIEKELKKKAAVEKRKFSAKDIKLPARVSFDALYVPDVLSRAKVIATTFAFNEAKEVRFLGDRTWPETASRPSLADQFLNGARTPQLSTGTFLSYLRRETNSPDGPLDLERQAFDSLILLRQAQYRASGNNGAKLIQALRASDFTVEGTASYGSVDAKGEPFARMMLFGYKSGRFTPELEKWERPKPLPGATSTGAMSSVPVE